MSVTGKIIRGFSPALLDTLDRLVDEPEDGAWWRDVLRRRDLMIAVRRDTLNVYYRGASIFQVTFNDGVVTPLTHAKYLSRRQQGLVPLHAGKFAIDAERALWSSYGPETLAEMMAAAANLAGPEKIHLHALLIASPHVIDVEISLEGVDEIDDQPDGANLAAEGAAGADHSPVATTRGRQDRLDVATLERDADRVKVVFHEAKHFSNAELRASPDRTPKVAGQIERYRRTLAHHADDLARSYREVCKALMRIEAMRQRLDPQSPAPDPLVQEIASSPSLLAIDPEPRLVIFGFDRDQRDGPVWMQHHQRLTSAPPAGFGLTVTALGSTAGRRAPAFS